jgi:hypothetical protein
VITSDPRPTREEALQKAAEAYLDAKIRIETDRALESAGVHGATERAA